MTTLLDIGIVGVFLYGLLSIVLRLARFSIRKPRQIRSDRTAVEHLATDRMIRENEHEMWPDRKFDHLNCDICGPGPLYQGKVPSQYKHPFYKMGKTWQSDGYGGWEIDVAKPSLPDTADMVSSLVVKDDKATGTHTVMLDLDMPVTLMESSTPEHYHLYIDHVMPWSKYKKLLDALRKAGLIEQGFYDASVRNHATMLRPPWVRKRHRHFDTGGAA